MASERTTRSTAFIAYVLLLGSCVSLPAHAFLAGDGKGKPERDCYIGIEGYGPDDFGSVSDDSRTSGIVCWDGEPSCDADQTVDGSCRFRFAVCVNRPGIDGCDPDTRRPRKITAKARSRAGRFDFAADLPGDLSSACGGFTDFDVPLKAPGKPGKGKLKLKARKPTDKDRITFVCHPGSPLSPPLLPCPSRGMPAAPDQVTFQIGASGTDLDVGWTSISHNFPVAPNGRVTLCLEGCDGTAENPVCTGAGSVGASSVNGVLFGAPQPLLGANVPWCLVHRFAQPVTGSANLLTGETEIDVVLQSEVYFTSSSEVCPRCGGDGRCTSGAREDLPCTTDAMLEVVFGNGDTTYELSQDCPPLGNPDGILDIALPLTSGTTAPLIGPLPCTGSGGLPPAPNECGESPCSASCTPGSSACVATVVHPADPRSTICQDLKGGLSQVCCENDPTKPCFPLEKGGALTRTGRAEPPAPALPDTSYPKAGTGVLGAVFCAGSTTIAIVDHATGLPGPAALLLPGTYEWSQQ